MKSFKWLSLAIILIVVITLIALGLFFYLRSTADEPKYKNGKLVIPVQDGEILISDIYADKKLTLPESETLVFYSSEEGLITYNLADNQFVIVVKDKSARAKMEKEFLAVTGVTEQQACLLRVLIGMPYEVSSDPTQSFKLSFCED